MPTLRRSAALLCAGLSLGAASLARAQESPLVVESAALTTLHDFTSGADGAQPVGALVQGSDGNFYGATGGGTDATSTYYHGTLYQLTPAGAFTILYTFTGGSDGDGPTAGLTQGADGNFYGTAILPNPDIYNPTLGTVFQLTPAGVFTTLYTFTGGSDGGLPETGLTLGPDGNLYGTTYSTVFQVTPAGALTTLYTFAGGLDGSDPVGPLVFDFQGNLYGTTAYGGGAGEEVYDDGTVFTISAAGVFKQLSSFHGGDGVSPGGLVLGRDTSLYGTTGQGPSLRDPSTAFNLSTAGVTLDGSVTTLHYFNENTDGANPSALVEGPDGYFYGTASAGGSGNAGTVFRVTPQIEGFVTDVQLAAVYNFTGGSDGATPYSPLILGSEGNFYGTTYGGGANGDGTVFRLTVKPAFFDGQIPIGGGFYFLAFPEDNYFGFYTFLSDPAYIFHLDLGYEYVTNANDRYNGVYLYDFASGHFFYTNPTFPFPYLYDFTLDAYLYYYPDPNNAGHYNTDGVRYFYDFTTGQTITM